MSSSYNNHRQSNNYGNNNGNNNGNSRRRQFDQDEAYAQALQEEYRQDFLRRQANKSKQAQPQMQPPQMQQQQQQPVTRQTPARTRSSNSKTQRSKTAKTSKSVASTSGNSQTKKKTVKKPPPSSSLPPASAPPEDLLLFPPPPPAPLPQVSSSYVPQSGGILLSKETDERYAWQLQQAEAQSSLQSRSTTNTFEQQQDKDLKLAQELQDEEYARRLQHEQQQQQQRQPRQGSQQRPPIPPQPVPIPPRSASMTQRSQSNFMDERSSSLGYQEDDVVGDLYDENEAAARRIQQELQDAEYAHRLSVLEQQQAAQQQQQQSSSSFCTRRLLPLLVCGTIIALVPLLFVFGVFDTNDLPPMLGDLFGDDWIHGDPWSGNTTNGPDVTDGAFAWPNSGNGVTLEILNACSDEWQVLLRQAIDNWDNGSPIDSLTLQTTRIDYESTCTEVRGKLKVCNGNYGDTRWRGLNEVMLNGRQNTILSSTARLNEYYLARESAEQRLYTACHELGHGFGLPHWDEDFFNKDLGNCMDYTQNPSRNSKPNESNFLFLAQLYGGRNVTATSSISTSLTSSAIEEATPPHDDDNANGNRRRTTTTTINSQLLDVVPHIPQRRILHLSDTHEVHLIPCPGSDDIEDSSSIDDDDEEDCRILQQFLLYKE
mmetsp:Transcript_3589/g.6304  ORF Transcript_3589/g.6304 Transcript_3589/m.6304 type:complete len:656 (+) Transcript_3589:303-2270(+)